MVRYCSPMEHDENAPEALTPSRQVARRMREVRNDRGWTAERLAEAMRKVGIPWERAVVTKLETGRRAIVSVDEVLALAYVLDVAPVHMLTPTWSSPGMAGEGEPTDDAEYRVTGTVSAPVHRVRAWIRGARPLPGTDPRRYLTEIPRQEWDGLMDERIAAADREDGRG